MSQSAAATPRNPSPPARHRRQQYEQLGAPVLLYRHLPSYSNVNAFENGINPGPWDANTSKKNKATERSTVGAKKFKQQQVAARAEEICTNDLQPINRAKMRQHGGLPMQLATRYEYDYHRPFAPGAAAVGTSTAPPPPVDFATRRRRRFEAFPEYCAPFGANLVAWGLTDELDRDNILGCNTSTSGAADDGRTENRAKRYKYYGFGNDEANEELTVPSVCRDVPPSPADYGNCLVALPCRCRSCCSSKRICQGWFVVHPTGERLDAVSISRILLPRQNIVGAGSISQNCGDSSSFFVGERLMQIVLCGARKRWNENDSGRRVLIVRTRSRCIVVSSTWTDSASNNEERQSISRNGCTGGSYTLRKVSDVDFFARTSAPIQSFAPIHVAPNPTTIGTSACAPTTFAVLSHSKPSSSLVEQGLHSTSTTPRHNAIHHAIVHFNGDCSTSAALSPSVKQYIFPTLRHISQIEFTHHHPMVLWASARSSALHKPAIHHKVITSAHKRPMSGRGSNLYTVDLRSCESAIVFNPSHAERMVDGLHSISSILPDCSQMHRVYVQSISAGSRVWEIDARMSGRSVCSWTMPGLCDDWGFTGRHGGLYGWGSLLNQPTTTDMSDTDLPLLGVNKSFGAGHIGMYRRPAIYPRFATHPLECSSFDVNSGNLGFSSSFSIVLPDISERIFHCGLATFKTDISSLLSKEVVRDILNCETDDVRDALCVLSMTSRGDLYGHALACHTLDAKMARSYEGLTTGCCAVPIPNESPSCPTRMDSVIEHNLVWRLQNDFPTPSRAIMPQSITSRDEVQPFYDFKRRCIPSNVDSRERPRRKLSSKRPTAENTQETVIPSDGEDKEIIPPTLYELNRIGAEHKGVVFNTIKFCPDKDGYILNSTGPSVSVKPVDASTVRKRVAQSHASVVLDYYEKTCEVVRGKEPKRRRDPRSEEIGEEKETDLLSCSLRKLQDHW